MTQPATHPTALAAAERDRVAEEFQARLQSRGVTVHINDSLAELGLILEAIESFEFEVERSGGDLMVDEPPSGQVAEPDDPAFVIPARLSGESATWFATRIEAATHQLQRRRPQG
ncbi:MAG: hypothetical protein ABIZ70_07955 [Gemmatimonadales bacterium]